jgi:hypothetical protein
VDQRLLQAVAIILSAAEDYISFGTQLDWVSIDANCSDQWLSPNYLSWHPDVLNILNLVYFSQVFLHIIPFVNLSRRTRVPALNKWKTVRIIWITVWTCIQKVSGLNRILVTNYPDRFPAVVPSFNGTNAEGTHGRPLSSPYYLSVNYHLPCHSTL